MTDDVASRVNPASLDLRPGAKPLSHGRDTGTSNIESNILNSAFGDEDIAAVEVETAALVAARRRRMGRFLKGPIPLADIAAAARRPGQALAVLLAIHHRVTLTRDTRVKLPKALMQQLGVTKDARARALRVLEHAGLVSVRRQVGQSPVIELKRTSQ